MCCRAAGHARRRVGDEDPSRHGGGFEGFELGDTSVDHDRRADLAVRRDDARAHALRGGHREHAGPVDEERRITDRDERELTICGIGRVVEHERLSGGRAVGRDAEQSEHVGVVDLRDDELRAVRQRGGQQRTDLGFSEAADGRSRHDCTARVERHAGHVLALASCGTRTRRRSARARRTRRRPPTRSRRPGCRSPRSTRTGSRAPCSRRPRETWRATSTRSADTRSGYVVETPVKIGVAGPVAVRSAASSVEPDEVRRRVVADERDARPVGGSGEDAAEVAGSRCAERATGGALGRQACPVAPAPPPFPVAPPLPLAPPPPLAPLPVPLALALAASSPLDPHADAATPSATASDTVRPICARQEVPPKTSMPDDSAGARLVDDRCAARRARLHGNGRIVTTSSSPGSMPARTVTRTPLHARSSTTGATTARSHVESTETRF